MKSVVITDLRTAEMREARDYLAAEGWQVLVPPEGIRLWKEEEVRAFADTCPETLEGVIHPAPPPFQCPLEQSDEGLAAKARDEGVMAAWCVTKAAGAVFRAKKSGCLIYIGSIHAEKPVGRGALFSMGCGAVQMLAREACQDYGQFNVNVYFIQKGVTAADPDSRSPVSAVYYGTDLRYPKREMPKDGHLNGLIAFLLTPEAAPLSGSDLRSDGGMTLYYVHRRKVEGRPYFDERK